MRVAREFVILFIIVIIIGWTFSFIQMANINRIEDQIEEETDADVLLLLADDLITKTNRHATTERVFSVFETLLLVGILLTLTREEKA